MRIALFVTCLADAMFPAVGQATVSLLERLGHQVVFPTEQTWPREIDWPAETAKLSRCR